MTLSFMPRSYIGASPRLAEENVLKSALLQDRLDSYGRLRGGFPIPLAGAIYWLVLAGLYGQMPFTQWANLACYLTGGIFPLALLLAKLFGSNFMKDKTATGDVLLPTFVSMLLFWPILAVTAPLAPESFVVILGIGMSLHWPVIGWSYGRTLPYAAHSIARAVGIVIIFNLFPEQRDFFICLFIAAIYLATTTYIYWDSRKFA